MSDDPLDQVNRFVVIVSCIAAIFAAMLVVMLAWAEPSGTIGRIEDFTSFLSDHETREGKVVITLAAAVLVLLMLTAIIVELTPPATQKMRLRNVHSGHATLTTTQIAGRVEREARAVPHVRNAAAIVAARGRRVEIVLDLHVDPAADLSAAADEACRRTQQLVEQQLGVELARPPRARLHYRELRLHERAPEGRLPEAATSGSERPPAAEEQHDQRRQPDHREEAQA